LKRARKKRVQRDKQRQPFACFKKPEDQDKKKVAAASRKVAKVTRKWRRKPLESLKTDSEIARPPNAPPGDAGRRDEPTRMTNGLAKSEAAQANAR
jgi:hypothetical protein